MRHTLLYIIYTFKIYMYLFYNIILKTVLVHSNIRWISNVLYGPGLGTTKQPLDHNWSTIAILSDSCIAILLPYSFIANVGSIECRTYVICRCPFTRKMSQNLVAKPCHKTLSQNLVTKSCRTKSCRTIHQKILSFLCTAQYIWSFWVCQIDHYVDSIALHDKYDVSYSLTLHCML